MESPMFSKKQCELWLANPIINPATNRRIKLEGATFTSYIGACMAHGINIQEKIDNELETKFKKCHNESDPITQDDFKDMDQTIRYEVITLGSGNCYTLESIYEHYKTRVADHKPVNDPLIPDYILTEDDIDIINSALLETYEDYHTPEAAVAIDLHPVGYELRFPDHIHDREFSVVSINNMSTGDAVNLLFTFPNDLNVGDTGSHDYTSANCMYQLNAIWNAGELTINNNPINESTIEGIQNFERLRNWALSRVRVLPAEHSPFISKALELFSLIKNKYDSIPPVYRI